MTHTPTDYSTLEAQEAFLNLSDYDKDRFIYRYKLIANRINYIMSSGLETKEIAGYKIFSLPVQSMSLTPEQRKSFQENGGIEVDITNMTIDERIEFRKNHPKSAIDWQVSFESLESEIDGILYKGFDLFKKVYEAFPDIRSMTKEEATEAGLYPIIHYRDSAAYEYIIQQNGGMIPTSNELDDMYSAASGETNIQKLAAMGQAPFGYYKPSTGQVYNIGIQALCSFDTLRYRRSSSGFAISINQANPQTFLYPPVTYSSVVLENPDVYKIPSYKVF